MLFDIYTERCVELESSKHSTYYFSPCYTAFFLLDFGVFAINNLYVALGSPPLPGWIPNGGDPCLEGWQGVQCVNSNITGIVINAANLGGELGDKLEIFSSIITIDLSNNRIGGSIPDNLPPTMRRFFLSANQFTGSIPSSLSTLTLLSDMSLNNNLLTGELPDAFQALTGLINLDLSFNNLSGQLPPSFESLSSLTTLHVQDNQISGTLNVLQDLPLQNLNIENNLFSGPVPVKMLSIPNFKKDGNPFNMTIAPSPTPPLSSHPPLAHRPTSEGPPGPSIQDGHSPKGNKKSLSTTRIVGIVLVAVILIIICVISGLMFCARRERESKADRTTKRQEIAAYRGPKEKPKFNDSLTEPSNQLEKVPIRKEVVQRPKEEHEVDMTGMGVILMPPPVENVIVNPIVHTESPKILDPPTSVKVFTVASLQQYTNSFGQENLIGGGMLGTVYRAELPDGKLLAIKKLDNASPMLQTDEAFLDLVSSISKLRHPNIVELVGYCAEHKQRLLVYEYCNNGALYDALHSFDELKKKLSWNARILMALGAARALEYLHEGCQPPIVHRNFKSANILLDDELVVHVSDCGLAPLILLGSVSQLSGHLRSLSFTDPHSIQSGTYTSHSDIYSFGVIMLELFTGRKSHDSSLPRGEQSLVEWAKHQLHDFSSLQRMVDPSLNGTYTLKSLSQFADIISLCVQSDPSFRPPISDIVQKLASMVPSRRSNGGTSSK
ncbi:protein STRUBBELIG-RECEPTOR FAMILY 3-like isoform X3 [Tasmannia lanceolata]|uniref:protein STRUBBELIG-RECEPTOR FAMILY 3-like isoform X3 n=1 Tax=Tasmannia lanceolata TaxID=3420 RepID=UPI0040646E4C